jgi:hypothetical protein
MPNPLRLHLTRTSRLTAGGSGIGAPSRFVAITSPSSVTSKMPPDPGASATAQRPSNVVSNSCAIHDARSKNRHFVQYVISTRGPAI